jgi:nucleotide-binding universal stress UspA family protein
MFKIKGPVLAAVALDEGSDDVVRQADEVARSYGTGLHVCHVLPEVLAVRPLFPNLHLDDALKTAELEGSLRRVLSDRVRQVTGRGAEEVGLILDHGSAYSGVLRASDRIAAGLVVVGGKVGAGGAHLLGGTAERVVRYAECPVLVARPGSPGRVLAATDFSDPAIPAVQAGATEARRRNVDLAIFHAVELLPPVLPSMEGQLAALTLDGINARFREFARQRLDDCVRQFEAGAGGLLVAGPAAPAILRAASELPAQLLVIGTHGRTGLSRIAMGSVAEEVVRSATCSVLVVRLSSRG